MLVTFAGQQDGVAVVRRAFQPLLRASIEGREIPTVPVNLAQIGVLVPAGKHRVVISASAGPEIAAAVVAGIVLVAGQLDTAALDSVDGPYMMAVCANDFSMFANF